MLGYFIFGYSLSPNMEIWLRKRKKIKVVFWVLFWGLRWSYTFFHKPFREVLVVCFLSDFFLFMFPRVMDSCLKHWDIYISFQGEKTCSWLSFLILVRLLLLLRVVVIVEWWLLLWRNLLTLIGEYSRSLSLSSQQVVSKLGCGNPYSLKERR